MSKYQPVVLEKEEGNRVSMDLPTRFFKDRVIFLTGVIEDGTAESIIQQLLYLDQQSHEPITLYINSPGGYCTEGIGILNTMECIQSPIHAIGYGMVCSMGATILCRCDKRGALEGTEIMFHQISGGAYGNIQDMNLALKVNNEINEYLLRKIAEGCDKTVKQLKKDMARDMTLFPEDAIKYGAIDYVIPSSNAEGKRKFKLKK